MKRLFFFLSFLILGTGLFAQSYTYKINPRTGRWDLVLDASSVDTVANWANVVSYGATGDGATSDSAAIESALAAADGIFFESGSYNIGEGLTIPAGKLLVFDKGAKLTTTDAVSLISFDDTYIWYSGQALDTSLNFSGTLRNEYITPSIFGTPADSSTDASAWLEKSADLARLTQSKKMVFDRGHYFIDTENGIDIKNLTIDLSGAKIRVDSNRAFFAIGSKGTEHDLDENAYYLSSFIKCANLADSVSPGDLVMIQADTYRSKEENDQYIGEIHLVKEVQGDYIIFNDYIFDKNNYLTAYSAKACKINYVTANISNGFIYDAGNWPSSTLTSVPSGIEIYYGKNIYLENLHFENIYGRAIALRHSYNTFINNCSNHNSAGQGYGYGISMNGACSYAIIQMNSYGARHAFTNGGIDNDYGTPWEIHYHNSHISHRTTSYAIGVHPHTGSVYFSDLVLTAGNRRTSYLTSDTTGNYSQWDSGTDYAANDTVMGSDGYLFVAQAASGPSNGGGVDPTSRDITKWYWITPGNDNIAVNLEAGSGYFDNIKATGFHYFFRVTSGAGDSNVIDNLYLSNIKAFDCVHGIDFSATGDLTINNFHVNGYSHINKYFNTSNIGHYGLRFIGEGASVENLKYDNLYFQNIGLLGINASRIDTDSIITINNPKIKYNSSLNDDSKTTIYMDDSLVALNINNGEFIGVGRFIQVLSDGKIQNLNIYNSYFDVYRNLIYYSTGDTTGAINIKSSFVNFRQPAGINPSILVSSINWNKIDMDINITANDDIRVFSGSGLTLTNLYLNNSTANQDMVINGTLTSLLGAGQQPDTLNFTPPTRFNDRLSIKAPTDQFFIYDSDLGTGNSYYKWYYNVNSLSLRHSSSATDIIRIRDNNTIDDLLQLTGNSLSFIGPTASFTGTNMTISRTNNQLYIKDSDDNKIWAFSADDNKLTFKYQNDVLNIWQADTDGKVDFFHPVTIDTIILGSFYQIGNTDSLWLEKPLGTWIKRLYE